MDRFLTLAGSEEQEEFKTHNARVDVKLLPLREELSSLTERFTGRLRDRKLASLPEPIRSDVREALDTPPGERDQAQKDLLAQYEARLKVEPKEIIKAFPRYEQESEKLEKSIEAAEAGRRALPRDHGLTDMEPDSLPFCLLGRREWNRRGWRVLPKVPAVLRGRHAPFRLQPSRDGAATTGQRLALARWLIEPDHPLTARVLVNRVWQRHFGTDIMATADDFGHMGAEPTHPQLLDWLAREFVDTLWSMKRLHRPMTTSSVYRQQTRVRPVAATVDPENKLLWRMRCDGWTPKRFAISCSASPAG